MHLVSGTNSGSLDDLIGMGTRGRWSIHGMLGWRIRWRRKLWLLIQTVLLVAGRRGLFEVQPLSLGRRMGSRNCGSILFLRL